MHTQPTPTLMFRGVLAAGAIALLLLAITAYARAGMGASACTAPATAKSAVIKPLPPDLLDALRMEAVQGNVEASADLTQRLLDQFDATGQRDSLYEAFQWIARDWDQREFLRTDVLQRAVGHCEGPVLRWSFLCATGE